MSAMDQSVESQAVQEACAWYRVEDVADQIGVSVRTVYSWLKRDGLDLETRQGVNNTVEHRFPVSWVEEKKRLWEERQRARSKGKHEPPMQGMDKFLDEIRNAYEVALNAEREKSAAELASLQTELEALRKANEQLSTNNSTLNNQIAANQNMLQVLREQKPKEPEKKKPWWLPDWWPLG